MIMSETYHDITLKCSYEGNGVWDCHRDNHDHCIGGKHSKRPVPDIPTVEYLASLSPSEKLSLAIWNAERMKV